MKKLLFILLFSISVTANAQYTKLLDFNGTTGSQPYGSLISDGTFLYGMTNQGGKAGYGVLFKIKPDGTAYDTLMSFLGVSNGAFPRGSLINDGTFLYGMTSQGGTGSRGTIFKIKPDGTGYVKLLDFLGTANGGNPEDDLMFDGTFLYGMTGQGGANGNGTIFKIKPDGTAYTNLYSFGDLGAYDASGPNGSLVYDGTFLYGVTPGGGINNTGAIFKIKPDGTGYVKIFDFSTTSSGIYPEASLISVGNFLYGAAHYGGASSGSGGVVFKIKPDGSEYAVLHDFSGIDGCTPVGSLIYEGTHLYGMTANGGTSSCGNGNGTIFKIRPDGTGFSKLLDFTGVANGKYPQGALYFEGGYLYGMTQLGGANNNGLVFKYYTFAIDCINFSAVSCPDGNDGTATAVACGGLAPYTYSWNTSPAQTTQTATGLIAGNYTVTVTDANSSSATASVTITQAPVNAINAGADSTITCGGSVHLDAQPEWVLLNSGTTQTLNSVYFVNNDTGYVAGNTGIILKTTNGGTNWTQQTSGSGTSLNFIYFVHPDTGYVTGTSGKILKTTDGGTTWTQQTTNMLDMLNSVYFINSNVGYVAGDSGNVGVFLKTTNGGTNWTRQIIETAYGFRSVYFTSIDTGYVVQGGSGNILKTTNGGTSWTTQTTGIGSGFRSIYFTNANTGYAVGDNGFIVKTTDAGANWTSTHISTGYFMCSVYFINTDTGYVVGDASTLLKTSDGGTTWIQQTSGTGTNVTLRSVHFPDANTGYVVGTSGKILKFPIISSYSWSPVNGLSDSTIANPIASPIITTKYFVTATSDNGCTAKDSVTINVNPLTVNSGIDKTIVCDGTAQLDSVTSNYTGSGLLTYNWSPTTGLNYDTIPDPMATVTENTIFYVTVTTSNGCTAIDSVTVYVDPLTAEAGMEKTIVCGGSVQLDNVTSNYTGTDSLTYNWSPAAGLNYDTILNPIAAVIDNTIFYVTVTTSNGCTAIDSVNVFVNPLTISGTDVSTFCGDSATLFTFTNYTGTGELTYSWLPVEGMDSASIASPKVLTDSNQTYSVTVTTPNGCVATDNVSVSLIPMTAPEICIVSVDSTNKNIIVWNKPVSVAIDSFYIYKETGITNVYAKIGAVSYDSLSIFVDNNSNPDVQSDKYKISIFDNCSLESAKSDYHKTMHLAINQGMGTTWNLIWEPYEGFTVSSYRIYRGTSPDTLQQIGTTLGGSTQYTDLTPPAGYVYYQVEVVSPNSCNPTKSFNSSRSNIASNNPDAINEISIDPFVFSIYPNPANDQFHIQSFFQIDYIEINDITGRLIFTTSSKDIYCREFAKGIYFIKVKTEAGVAVKKFIRE